MVAGEHLSGEVVADQMYAQIAQPGLQFPGGQIQRAESTETAHFKAGIAHFAQLFQHGEQTLLVGPRAESILLDG